MAKLISTSGREYEYPDWVDDVIERLTEEGVPISRPSREPDDTSVDHVLLSCNIYFSNYKETVPEIWEGQSIQADVLEPFPDFVTEQFPELSGLEVPSRVRKIISGSVLKSLNHNEYGRGLRSSLMNNFIFKVRNIIHYRQYDDRTFYMIDRILNYSASGTTYGAYEQDILSVAEGFQLTDFVSKEDAGNAADYLNNDEIRLFVALASRGWSTHFMAR